MASADTLDRDRLRQTHQLADTTFRNVEEFMEDMKFMVSAAKTYHRSLQAMATASDNFFGVMESVGAKASNLPGAVRKLGSCMLDMVASHKHMSENQEDWIQSLNTEFIVPMEMKLKEERNDLIKERRRYKNDAGKRVLKVKKTRKMVRKVMKKKTKTRSQTEKQVQLKNLLTEHTEMMRVICVEGLRKALIEERKLYCFCVDHFCSVLRNQISYNAISHRVFSTHIHEWSALCSTPDELPPESAVLLTDPRSASAFSPSELKEDGDDRAPGSMLAEALQMVPTNRQRRVSCRVKALYPHQNATGEQLEFHPGDFIDAIDEPQDGWQYGENTRTGGTGWFPVQYVHKIWPSPSPNKKRVDGSHPSTHHNPSQLTMGSSATEREYLHQGGSGSRRSSQTSMTPSFRQ